MSEERMTNEEVRSFFWDRIEDFELEGSIDIDALVRVFGVTHPDESVDSFLDEIDRVRYLALEVAELYREGWRPTA